MENKKHKILKRVVPILCAVLVLAIALITPISAIVNSSQGSFNDYDITACSSFPLTVGFSYSTRDLSTGLGNSYVYSTYVGQFGEEFNKTIEGDEEYTLLYDAGNGLRPYNLTGKLSYTMLGQHWNETVYINGASGAEGYFRRGYNGIVATNNTPASGNVSGYQQGVVLKASDVVFNPRSVYTITEEIENDTVVQSLNVITDANVLVNVLPTFKTPDIVENEGGYGVTLTYSYNVKLRTPDNQEITFSDTATYDNRTEGYVGREIVPIIDPHSLIGVSGGYYFDTIVIEDYNGYLEYKYYTYTAPTISFTVGENSYTTQEGTTWEEFATTTDGFRYLDTSEGTGIQYQTGDNTWSEIFYNGVAVGPTDVIISGASYTIIDILGTWKLKPQNIDVSMLPVPADSNWYGFYGSFQLPWKDGAYTFQSDNMEIIIGNSSLVFNNIEAWDMPYVSFDEYPTILYSVDFNDVESVLWDTYGYFTIENYTSADGLTDFQLYNFLQANATKQSTASVAVASDEPTTTPTDTSPRTTSGTWNEVNRSESCELELTYPLLDVSNVVNTGSNAYNSYYRWYSFPTVEKLLTSAEYAEVIPLPEAPQVDMTSWIGTAVGGFLNMELMPYFSIGGVLAIIIGFAVLMMILKWLAGG